MLIRPETPADIATIHALTEAAFAPMAFSDGTEADCIDGLRRDGDLTLSLVAEGAGKVIGHVAYSPAFIDGEGVGWYGLGPIAVEASCQKQGIGSKLAAVGHVELRKLGAAGVVLIGKPEVYGPMGFISDGRLSYRDVPASIVQYLAFGEPTPSGEVTFSPALETA